MHKQSNLKEQMFALNYNVFYNTQHSYLANIILIFFSSSVNSLLKSLLSSDVFLCRTFLPIEINMQFMRQLTESRIHVIFQFPPPFRCSWEEHYFTIVLIIKGDNLCTGIGIIYECHQDILEIMYLKIFQLNVVALIKQ